MECEARESVWTDDFPLPARGTLCPCTTSQPPFHSNVRELRFYLVPVRRYSIVQAEEVEEIAPECAHLETLLFPQSFRHPPLAFPMIAYPLPARVLPFSLSPSDVNPAILYRTAKNPLRSGAACASFRRLLSAQRHIRR